MPSCNLELKNVEFPVHLGWTEEERQFKQIVLIDIILSFKEPPIACDTDELKDTLCYATLIEKIQKLLAHKEYKLLEHLAKDVYLVLKKENYEVDVSVTKKIPLPEITGNATIHFGDKIIKGDFMLMEKI